METQNIEKRHIEKYILIHFHNADSIILKNNENALDYIIRNSYEIEGMEYITLVVPS